MKYLIAYDCFRFYRRRTGRIRALACLPLFLLALAAVAPMEQAAAQSPPGDPPAFGAMPGTWLSQEEKAALKRSFSPQQRDFLVDVGPRLIAPARNTPVGLEHGLANVYVQFHEPLRARERGRFTRMGLRFEAAIDSHTYLAQVRPQALRGLRNHPLFRGIEPVEPLDKLTPALGTGQPPAHALTPEGRVIADVRFFERVRLAEALSVLDSLDVEVTDRSRMQFNNRVEVRLTPAQLQALADRLQVRAISEVPPPPTTMNADSAANSNVDILHAAPFNLDGDGVVMGIWDGGPVRDVHPDLSPRVTIAEGDQDESDHATHVAGTMISSGVGDPAARGMAPAGGELYSYDFGDNTASEQSDAVDDFDIVLSNHSWGAIVGWDFDDGDWSDTGNAGLFGRYNGRAQDYDALVIDKGLLVQKSSGNEADDCNPDDATDCDGVMGSDGRFYRNISGFGNAKNLLTIGAINKDATTITGFSSAGPTNDFRIKPDLVATGSNMWSTCSSAARDDNADYCFKGGTSMSTPTVSGIVGLLVERYRENYEGQDPSPEVIKALTVNTAVDLGRPGPDYIFGHGLVDALAAVEIIDVGAVRIVTNAADQDDLHEWVLEVPAGMDELRATLAWVDPEGPTGDGAVLINDLDVSMIDPEGGIHYPFSGPTGAAANWTNNATASAPNTVDNVEHARVDSPQAGIWTVRVNGTAVPEGPQNYALVANSSFILPDEPNIEVNAALDFDELCDDEFQDKTVSIFNTGGADLWVHSVAVTEGAADFEVLPNPTQPLVIRPGAHVDLTVRFSASALGLRTGVLEIQSNDADEGVLEFDMTGSGGEPDIATVFNGDFGDVCLGTSATRELRIANAGSCPLSVDNITTLPGSEFSVADVVSFPLSVSPGTEVTVPIEFSPEGDFGARSESISIYHDDPDADWPVVLPLSANVPSGSLNTALADSGDFGSACKGEHSDLNLTLFNQGQCNLTIDSLEILPPGSSFQLPDDLDFPLVLSHDADFNVPVRYAPESCSDVAEEAEIEIVSDDPAGEIVTIPVSGVSPCPNLVIDPEGLDALFAFPATVVDADDTLGCHSDAGVVLRNNGGCPLTIDDIGTGTPDFGVIAPTQFPVILPPGEETLGVNVRFHPQQDANAFDPTEFQDVLTIVSDDPDASGEAALCGEGVAQSGVRIAVTDVTTGIPMYLDPVERVEIQSKGKNRPGPIKLTFDDAPLQTANVCNRTVSYHVNQETLPATDTTGGGGNQSSYEAKAKQGNLQTSQSFTLGQCEFREFQLQLQSSDSDPGDPGSCPLLPKGAACTTDGECCSGKCRGPEGAQVCR